jgi:uncharacterized LabA/DUF88 family protein
MNVTVFVDGFNLYHSIANKRFPSLGKYKWLDVSKLINKFIPLDRHNVKILYFTSLTEWSVTKMNRHKLFIRALESTGIETIYGKFKLVDRDCMADCKKTYQTYAEKRTDSNIAVNLLYRAEKEYEQAIIVSGDSDLIPAVEMVNKIYEKKKKIGLIIPINREADELSAYCFWKRQITQKQLAESQFPNVLKISETETITRPREWC